MVAGATYMTREASTTEYNTIEHSRTQIQSLCTNGRWGYVPIIVIVTVKTHACENLLACGQTVVCLGARELEVCRELHSEEADVPE